MQPAPSPRADGKEIRLPGRGLRQNRLHRLSADTAAVRVQAAAAEIAHLGRHPPLRAPGVRGWVAGMHQPDGGAEGRCQTGDNPERRAGVG